MSVEQPQYSSDYKTLINVPSIVEIIIDSRATSIKGVKGGDYAFKNAKSTIERVLFAQGSCMESISPSCFLSCSKLSSIDFSSCSSITSIGDDAFSGCTSLKSITLPSTVKEIGNGVFSYSGLTSLHIPASVEKYGIRNCYVCRDLTEFTIDPNSPMTFLDDHQFTSTKLKSLKLTKNIVSFSGANFENVVTIQTLSVDSGNEKFTADENVIYSDNGKILVYAIPTKTGTYKIRDGVQNIYSCAFHSSNITGVVFPSSLNNIFGFAFKSSKLQTLHIPKNVMKIDGFAFNSCKDLRNVTFEDGLQNIGSSCFAGCDQLTKVFIPKTIKSLGGSAFPLSVDLSFAPGADLKFSDDKKFILNLIGSNLIQCISTDAEITIPTSVTNFVSYSFSNIMTIKKVIIPPSATVTKIGESAFLGSSIAEINLPDSLESIGPSAFLDCNKLRKIHFGSKLSTIEKSAFSRCALLDTIESSDGGWISLKESAFASCSSLQTVDFKGRLTEVGKNCFLNCAKISSIAFTDVISLIGASAFQGTGLETVTFPPNSPLEVIPIRCFYQCSNLSTYSIPNGVTKIMNEAFAFTAIKSISLPKSVKEIYDSCFEGCHSLVNFTIPSESDLVSIGYGVFLNCPSFKSIDVNNSPHFSISNDALFDKNMTQLFVLPPMSPCKYFSFPTTLITVGSYALQGCQNIEVIFVPSSVTEIMQFAFSNCINLRSINIPKECEKIGVNVFNGCKKMQCGIPIENKSPEFIKMLVTECSLSKNAVQDCSLMCHTIKNRSNFRFIGILLFKVLLVC